LQWPIIFPPCHIFFPFRSSVVFSFWPTILAEQQASLYTVNIFIVSYLNHNTLGLMAQIFECDYRPANGCPISSIVWKTHIPFQTCLLNRLMWVMQPFTGVMLQPCGTSIHSLI